MHFTTTPRSRRHTRGFTLIELLTVIAIIGILAAIIIPTVGSVRSKAKAVQCSAKLREWGNAVRLLANDSKGNIPLMIDLSSDTTLHFYDRYFPKDNDTTGTAQLHSVDYWSVCPSITRTVSDNDGNRRFYNFLSPNKVREAAIGSSLFGTGAINKKVDYYNLTHASAPSRLILMMEMAPSSSAPLAAGSYTAALSGADGQVRKIMVNTDKTLIRHNGRINVLYLDGSTRSCSLSDLEIKLGGGTTAGNDPRITL